jgi:hypothetical protein
MREYKGLTIPNRHPRVTADIFSKQLGYCQKSNCDNMCNLCLFGEDNIEYFESWYIAKNKKDKQ